MNRKVIDIMEIRTSAETSALLKKRQEEKFAAIRANPIYDNELQVPVRGTNIRCLEFVQNLTGQQPVDSVY